MSCKDNDIENYRIDASKFILDESRNSYNEFSVINFGTYNNKKCIRYRKKDSFRSEKVMFLFNQEVRILSLCIHPAIAPFIGFSIDQDKYGCIYIEEFENGSLSSMIHKMCQNAVLRPKEEFTPTQKYIISYGIALAMQFLHKCYCLHRGLKTENVLLDSNLYPYVTGFENSTNVANKDPYLDERFAMVPKITPPEIIDDECEDEDIEYKDTFPIDVYSYGITLFEIWANYPIYKSYKRAFGLYRDILDGYREEIPPTIPNNWKNLIEKCWSQKPNDRPTFDQVVQMLQSSEYLTKDINKNEVEKYEQHLNSKNLPNK